MSKLKTENIMTANITNILTENKIVNTLNTLDKSMKNYIQEIFTELSYNNNDFVRKLTNFDNKRISEFLVTLYHLKIKDIDALNILIEATSLLECDQSLLNAIKIQDNYLKNVLCNRPYFDFDTKINCILNACKEYNGVHVIKKGNLFLNTQKDGFIPDECNDAEGESLVLGLFSNDMRFVNEHKIEVFSDNKRLKHQLNSVKNIGYSSEHDLCFDDKVYVKRKRVINTALFEKVDIRNTLDKEVKVNILISGKIKDIFEVRGKFKTVSEVLEPVLNCDGTILLNTEFQSGNVYGVEIKVENTDSFLLPKNVCNMTPCVLYEITVEPSACVYLDFKIQPVVNNKPFVDGVELIEPVNSFDEALNLIELSKDISFSKIDISTDIENSQEIIDKSMQDLNMLVNYLNIDGRTYSYIGAGLPRYSALFGRDSLITALQVFPLKPDIARDTIELLALFQGKAFEQRYEQELFIINNMQAPQTSKQAMKKGLKEYYNQREEDQGKILHELRVGELVNTTDIPHAPYYGTVDATALWLILYAQYYFWSGDKEFVEKYLPHAQNAADWIDKNIINGYLRFNPEFDSKVKIQNQGWKDAGDSIKHVINCDNFLDNPNYPIALAEVQGYVYKAFCLFANINKEFGYIDYAKLLNDKAECLKASFNNDFWLENEQFYSMALDKNNVPVNNVTSNIGHCLAMDIIDDNCKGLIEQRLMSSDMYTGWGIRTLSNKNPAYDAISYHNGSVWIHDSAIVASGMSKGNMAAVTKNLIEAANMFENHRLPELFGGFQRKENDKFIQDYPEACSPQAWASSSIVFLLLKLIDLKVENNKISYDNSFLPEWIKKLSIKNFKVGNDLVNLDIL